MKTVRKTVCVLALCAAAVGIASEVSAQAPSTVGAPASAGAAKKTPPPPPEAARVLDLSGRIPIVIDEPGYYRLDRDWRPDHQGAQSAFLDIRASNVTLDFRGYSISVANEGAAIWIVGSNVTLRNGSVSASDDQGFPLGVHGGSATIENMRVGGQTASYFGGVTNFGLVLRDSELFTGAGGVPPGSTLERNVFYCRAPSCGVEISDDTRVADNVWPDARSSSGAELAVRGSGNLIERNVFAPQEHTSVSIDGRGNLLRDNDFQADGFVGPVLQVNNGANVLEANIVLPIPGGQRATIGIQFTADGNSFGNNRVGALVPIDLGATTQTDWGGNVGL